MTELEIILRLLLAAVLGALVGLERECHNQPAGLRTHIILVIGSALAMTISIGLANRSGTDPARLAAQVLSGIGFLGAGAIMRYGTNVRGLTTAASLWTMAVVGLAVGAGMYLVAVATTGILMLVLSLLNLVERKMFRNTRPYSIMIVGNLRAKFEAEVREELQSICPTTTITSVERSNKNQKIRIRAVIRIKETKNLNEITTLLSGVNGVQTVKVE